MSNTWGPGYGDLGKLLRQQARDGQAARRGAAGPPKRPAATDPDSRPDAASVPVGTSTFDVELKAPLWSDGTRWVTAAGVPVGEDPEPAAAPADPGDGGGTGGADEIVTAGDAVQAVYDTFSSGDQSDVYWDGYVGSRGGYYLQLNSNATQQTRFPSPRPGTWTRFAAYSLVNGPMHGSTRFELMGTPADPDTGPLTDYAEVIVSAAWSGADGDVPRMDVLVVKSTRLAGSHFRATWRTGIDTSIDAGSQAWDGGRTVDFWVQVPDTLGWYALRRSGYAYERARYFGSDQWALDPGGTAGRSL